MFDKPQPIESMVISSVQVFINVSCPGSRCIKLGVVSWQTVYLHKVRNVHSHSFLSDLTYIFKHKHQPDFHSNFWLLMEVNSQIMIILKEFQIPISMVQQMKYHLKSKPGREKEGKRLDKHLEWHTFTLKIWMANWIIMFSVLGGKKHKTMFVLFEFLSWKWLQTHKYMLWSTEKFFFPNNKSPLIPNTLSKWYI